MEARWSYRQAEKVLGIPRRTLARQARMLGLGMTSGPALDAHGLYRLARLNGVVVTFVPLPLPVPA